MVSKFECRIFVNGALILICLACNPAPNSKGEEAGRQLKAEHQMSQQDKSAFFGKLKELVWNKIQPFIKDHRVEQIKIFLNFGPEDKVVFQRDHVIRKPGYTVLDEEFVLKEVTNMLKDSESVLPNREIPIWFFAAIKDIGGMFHGTYSTPDGSGFGGNVKGENAEEYLALSLKDIMRRSYTKQLDEKNNFLITVP